MNLHLTRMLLLLAATTTAMNPAGAAGERPTTRVRAEIPARSATDSCENVSPGASRRSAKAASRISARVVAR